jgi:hypothetical protein
LKDSGKWTEPPDSLCSNTESFIDNYQLDLYEGLRATSQDNILKAFHLDKNGNNYAQFVMKIERLTFKERQAEAELREKLGTWKTGFGEEDLIKEESGKGSSWKAHQALTVFRIVTVVVRF